MKKFISTFVLVLIIIGLIIGLGYTGKTIIRKNTQITQLNQQISDLKSNVSSLNDTIEKLQDSSTNTKIEVPNQSKEDNANKALFNAENIINNDEGAVITSEITDNMGVLSIKVDSKSNSLIIDINKELARLIYGYEGDANTHTVAGFSQKIIDAKIAIIGSDTKDLKIVLLMEDGTIKYLNIDSILNESYTLKTVPEEKDYVKIIKVSIKTNETSKYGIVGIKNDGTNKIISFN